jgi:hypothetical protein
MASSNSTKRVVALSGSLPLMPGVRTFSSGKLEPRLRYLRQRLGGASDGFVVQRFCKICDAAAVSLPAGQQPERGGHQLQFAPGDASPEAPEGIGEPLAAARTILEGQVCSGDRRMLNAVLVMVLGHVHPGRKTGTICGAMTSLLRGRTPSRR